jgi:hypothetical protein
MNRTERFWNLSKTREKLKSTIPCWADQLKELAIEPGTRPIGNGRKKEIQLCATLSLRTLFKCEEIAYQCFKLSSFLPLMSFMPVTLSDVCETSFYVLTA